MSIASLTQNCFTPLQLLNLYFSDGQSTGNERNWFWRRMNGLLTWENMLARGYQADLCPLLYFILTKKIPRMVSDGKLKGGWLNGLVPADILSSLKQHYLFSLKRNIILLHELEVVLAVLKDYDIQTVVLKGSDLALNVYEDIACRPMGDLDILVKEKDKLLAYDLVLQHDKLMRKIGFEKATDSKLHNFHQKYFKATNDIVVVIEIHWDLARKPFGTSIDIDNIFSCAVKRKFAGTTTKTMDQEQTLLYLMWHGGRHGFARLMWIYDIAVMQRKFEINYQRLHKIAMAWRISSPAQLGMELSRVIFGGQTVDSYSPRGNKFYMIQIMEYLIYYIHRDQRKIMQKFIIEILWFLLLDKYTYKFTYIPSRINEKFKLSNNV